MTDPRWDICLPYGEEGERTVAALLGMDGAKVEVKRKSYLDAFFYVETLQAPRRGAFKPSGVSITQADYWAFCVADTGVVVLVPTARLRASVRLGRKAQEQDGDNPTKGRLVHLDRILRVACEGRAAA